MWSPDGAYVGFWSDANQNYEVISFVDPIITIDEAFADDYELLVSYMPPTAVPESSSTLLFAVGLIGLMLVWTRRK